MTIITTYFDKKPFIRFEVNEDEFKPLLKTWGNRVPIDNFMNYIKLNYVNIISSNSDLKTMHHMKMMIKNLKKESIKELINYCLQQL